MDTSADQVPDSIIDQSDTIICASVALKNASQIVVFTGAGMSADSGIETFRGSNGTWNGIFGWLLLLYGGTPFGWNLTPGFVWSQFVTRFYTPIAEAKPHDGYFALTKIEKDFCLKNNKQFSVITMNVDGLHQASGSNPDNVYEIHGSIRKFRCGKCNASMNHLVNEATITTTAVRCDSCNKGPQHFHSIINDLHVYHYKSCF